MLKHVKLNDESIHCSSCVVSRFCMPDGMNADEIEQLNNLVQERIRINKGAFLFHANTPLLAVYSVRSGSLKTQIESENGQSQITGFFLAGELIGLDGFGANIHLSSAIALEDSEVCTIRLDDLDRISQAIPNLQTQFRRILSREISRSHSMVLALGSLRSEQRVAAFILNMANSYNHLGYSANAFILRMGRGDIGNYLGLTLETVSRLLSKFDKEGLIKLNQREVQILNKQALTDLLRN